ncbi:MAG: GLUG motif-containing protein, partial [Marinobacter sp.]
VTTRADDGQTGEWLIDPQDYTVAPEGGDITGSALSGNLTNNNVTIESVQGGENGNGDIFVSDEVTWSSGNTLTLNAQRDIEINAEVDASEGSGGRLSLEYAQGDNTGDYLISAPVNLQAGQNFTTKNAGEARILYTVIDDLELLKVLDHWGENFALGADVDWTSTANWVPVGNEENEFSGNFDGLGHTISNLKINSDQDHQGFFGNVNGSDIRNLGFIDAAVQGGEWYTGVLVGDIENSNIRNVYSTDGTVQGDYAVGGLIGTGFTVSIADSYSISDVKAASGAGGIAGSLYLSSEVKSSYAAGKVSSNGYDTGGLTGTLSGSVIENSFATGNVDAAGGRAGGLVGSSEDGALIENSYSTGEVSGDNSEIGGLIGVSESSSVIDSYWDTQTSGQDESAGGTGKTSEELSNPNTYSGWDRDIWYRSGYVIEPPKLAAFAAANDVLRLFEGGRGVESDPYTITDWHQLRNISHNNDVLTGGYHYALANTVDANTEGYNNLASESANDGKGWEPIGDPFFTGHFDGQNNIIADLNVARDGSRLGLFSAIDDGSARRLTLHNPSIQATGTLPSNLVGSLAGVIGNTTVDHILVTGEHAGVSGYQFVGGVIGYSVNSSIVNSLTSANVVGDQNSESVGGLSGDSRNTTIDHAIATGDVSGGVLVGGLVGHNQDGSTVRNSEASGNVTVLAGTREDLGYAGRLVGLNKGKIENASASGSIDNDNATMGNLWLAEGLVGDNWGTIHNGYTDESNTAYWLQHDGDLTLSNQPDAPAEASAAGIRNRLQNGINANLATTGTGGDITSRGAVDLGDASEHDSVLNLEALGEIALNSTQALRLGEVAAADAIDIASLSGDLLLTGDITTSEDSNQALVLNAGENARAGTVRGGDIVHTGGEFTTGDGGRAVLYTGSLSASQAIAGLTDPGNVRYHSDEINTNYTEPLDAGRYLIYREHPDHDVSFPEGEFLVDGFLVAKGGERLDTGSMVNSIPMGASGSQPQQTLGYSNLPVQVAGTGIRITTTNNVSEESGE